MASIKIVLWMVVILALPLQEIGAQNLITTLAGSNNGENVPALNYAINTTETAVDRQGNIYFAANNTIRKKDAGSGLVTTIAGDGIYGYNGYGDGGPALAARFNGIGKIVVDNYSVSLYQINIACNSGEATAIVYGQIRKCSFDRIKQAIQTVHCRLIL